MEEDQTSQNNESDNKDNEFKDSDNSWVFGEVQVPMKPPASKELPVKPATDVGRKEDNIHIPL